MILFHISFMLFYFAPSTLLLILMVSIETFKTYVVTYFTFIIFLAGTILKTFFLAISANGAL